MRRLLYQFARRFFMWTMRSSNVVRGGTGIDEPAQARIRWNDPQSALMRPLFAVELIIDADHTFIVLSPAQFEAFIGYGVDALAGQRRAFGYDDAPDYDVRKVA